MKPERDYGTGRREFKGNRRNERVMKLWRRKEEEGTKEKAPEVGRVSNKTQQRLCRNVP